MNGILPQSAIFHTFIVFLSLFIFSIPAAAQSMSEKSTHELPLTELNLNVFFGGGISLATETERNITCEKWLRAFAPKTGPWGYGLAEKGQCTFDYSVNEAREKISHTKIYLYITKEEHEKSSHKFELCWPKLSALKNNTVENFKGSLKCLDAIFSPAEVGADVIAEDEAFMKWVAAQLMETSPIFSHDITERESGQRNKMQTEYSSEPVAFLPSPPEEVLKVEISFDDKASKYLVKPLNTEIAAVAHRRNTWLMVPSIPSERRQAYKAGLENFISQFKSRVVISSSEAVPIFNASLILSQGLQISSLKSDYGISLMSTIFLTPYIDSQLGFYHKSSRYSLNLSRIPEIKRLANSEYVVQFKSTSVGILPVRLSLPAPNARLLYNLTFAPVYLFENRDNSMKSELPDSNQIDVEGRGHHLAGVESSAGAQLIDGVWLTVAGRVIRDLSEKTTDTSTLLKLEWFNSPSTPREGFHLGLLLNYQSIERQLKLSIGSNTAQLNSIFNSLHVGIGFGYGH